MFKKILIVEDLDDSRFFLKSILESRSLEVIEAENGKIALEQFKKSEIDLVLTDIRMPEMDGLMLLRAIRQSSPQTPVIIVSAYRESDNIINALRNGACDYITKPYDSEEIFSSIDRAARLQEMVTVKKTFAGSLRRESRRFEFENDPKQTNSIAQFLCSDLENTDLQAEKQSLKISLIEAINNAIYHGNLEMSSSIKNCEDGSSFDVFEEMAQERCQQAPYNKRRLTVDYSMDDQKISYTIRDDGVGFDFSALSDPLDPESFHRPSGRGLLMIRTFCDDVTWNERGNGITLVKYRGTRLRKG